MSRKLGGVGFLRPEVCRDLGTQPVVEKQKIAFSATNSAKTAS